MLFLLLYAGVPIEAQQQSGFPIDTHVFAGGIVANETGTLKEYGASFFSGAAWATGPIWAGFSFHNLSLNQAGRDDWDAFVAEIRQQLPSAELELESLGMDFSIGIVRRAPDAAFELIPMLIVGRTTAGVHACIDTGKCVDEDVYQNNVGGGLVVGINRLHLGFRYTRNYGVAMSFGYIFR